MCSRPSWRVWRPAGLLAPGSAALDRRPAAARSIRVTNGC
jgi:hypothetical protein